MRYRKQHNSPNEHPLFAAHTPDNKLQIYDVSDSNRASRASVAQTLVGLGVELSSLETRSTLQSAIAFALRQTGETLAIR